jgi:hypothetical protein
VYKAFFTEGEVKTGLFRLFSYKTLNEDRIFITFSNSLLTSPLSNQSLFLKTKQPNMLHLIKPTITCLLLLCFGSLSAQGYKIPLTNLSLDDLSAFKPQAGNWQIIGDVQMDRNIDVHEKGNASVKTKAGKGIIINLNNPKMNDPLLTSWEHGDIDLELEFMMPHGSNSGVYLQGRYEVQLFDSWGVRNPQFTDLGGIFRNWDTVPGHIYMGKAPLSNPARPPGLWQKMAVSFRAPRFDASGKKTANALLNYVTINGVTIHENVEIPLPTGGPIADNETAMGPLMIQGDHGAVAFRNIKYRLFKNQDVSLSGLTYKYWNGKNEKESDYKDKTPDKTGSLSALNFDFNAGLDTFGVQYTGKINVSENGTYFLTLITNGGSALFIDGKNVINNPRAWRWDVKTAEVALTSGAHDIQLFYHRHDMAMPALLSLSIEGANLSKRALNDPTTFPSGDAVSPILVRVGGEPKILRAFLDFQNNRKLRRTHTVGVGDPSGVHYVFDTKLGVLSCVWRGDFVDATPMWHDRGDGSFKPLGDVLFLSNTPQLAVLSDKNAAFPTTFNDTTFRGKGYKIEESSARPIFRYMANGLNVEDKTYPSDKNRSLTREVKISNLSSGQNAFFRLANGKMIDQLPDGSYLVDGRYYLTVLSTEKAFVRDANGQKELVVGANGGVKYEMAW